MMGRGTPSPELEKAAAALPHNAAILNNLGSLRNEVGACQGAIEVLERSLLAYDCMDFYRAFPHVKEPLVALEDELLACADLFLLPSEMESFGLVALEALAREHIAVETIIARLAGRYDEAVLRTISTLPDVSDNISEDLDK